MRRVREHRSPGLGRSLTLLRAFLLTSAAILAAGAIALSSARSSDLRRAALEDTALDLAAYTDAVLALHWCAGKGSPPLRSPVGASAARFGSRVTCVG